MMSYFNELKNRISLIFLSFFFTFFLCYFYKESILFLLIKPSYIKFSYFIFTNVLEIFSVFLNLIIFISLQVTFFYFTYQIVVFFSSAMSLREFHIISSFFRLFFIFWFGLIHLLSFFLLPLFWNFFLGFQNISFYSVSLYFEAKLNEYLEFFISSYYLCFFYYQLISVIFSLFYNMFSDIKLIKKIRKISYFFFVIFSVMISPPDGLTLFCLSFCSISIYEVFVLAFLGNFFLRR